MAPNPGSRCRVQPFGTHMCPGSQTSSCQRSCNGGHLWRGRCCGRLHGTFLCPQPPCTASLPHRLYAGTPHVCFPLCIYTIDDSLGQPRMTPQQGCSDPYRYNHTWQPVHTDFRSKQSLPYRCRSAHRGVCIWMEH